MRAVWSFWSKPYRAFYHRSWLDERTHLLSWALSISEASRHYPITCLHTDAIGAELLVDRLKLPFRHVFLTLDELNVVADHEWWVLGKLATYAAQTEPFVHLDNDVFLWKPLPARMTDAPVLAQNPERFDFEDQSLYRIDAFMRGIERFGGWVPEEWADHFASRANRAICCGILGGRDVELLRRYANLAMEIIHRPENQPIWPTLGVRDNILVEQYFLAAYLGFHAAGNRSASSVRAEFLFPSSNDAFDPAAAQLAGYTHLIGDAKRNIAVAERLEQRVKREYPKLHDACMGQAFPSISLFNDKT